MPNQQRVVMLVDFDYFYAQLEEQRHPELQGKPIVVGMYSGRTEISGAVATSNYQARKCGVKSGLPLYLAKKRLEGTDAAFLPVDYDHYQQVSDKIMAILRLHADILEIAGIDEAYMDVTLKTNGSYEIAEQLAAELKSEVKLEIGITFSVGIGPNKLIAKIASEMHKPDGVTVIRPDDVGAFLSPMPVDALLGVGKKTVTKLDKMGVKTVGDLANVHIQQLVSAFGKVLGVYFHNSSRGIDESPVQEATEAESIGRMGTLKEDSRDPDYIMRKIDELTDEVYAEFMQKKLSYRLVGITAVHKDLSGKTRSKTLEKTAKDKETIRRAARELLDRYLTESDMDIRRVGVHVGRFSKEEREQQQLTSFFGNT